MGKPVVFLFFVAVLLLGQRIFIRFLVKANSRFLNNGDAEIGENDLASDWKNSGKYRDFENAEYELGEEDFFENEVTEAESLYEAFEGLSDDEVKMIAEETGIFKTAGGENE